MTDVVSAYPLSPWQRYVLIESLLKPRPGIFVHQHHIRLDGPLDVTTLFRACQLIGSRYEVFRTRFNWTHQPEPRQEVLDTGALPWTTHDWESLKPAERNRHIERLRAQERAQLSDLSGPALSRLCLIRFDETHHHLVWTYHCLLLDGWSAKVVLLELETIYAAMIKNGRADLAKPQPFSNYVAWLSHADREGAAIFWQRHLAGLPPTAPTPFESLGQHDDQVILQRTRHFPPMLQVAIRHMTETYHFRVETLLHGAWALLLSQHVGNRTVVFGSTIQSRDLALPGIEVMVGPLTNLLPIRIDVIPSMPLSLWLQRIEDTLQARSGHAHLSLMEVAEAAGRDPMEPMFNTAILPESFAIVPSENKTEGEITGVTVNDLLSYPLPLCLSVDVSESIFLKLQYDQSRVDKSGAERLLDQLMSLLLQFSVSPETPLEEMDLLGKEDLSTLLKWCASQKSPDMSLPELFLESVELEPDRIATVRGNHHLSIGALSKGAWAIQGQLQEAGIGIGFKVGIWTHDSLKRTICQWGVWLAGGVWIDVTQGASAHKACDALLVTRPEAAPTHPLRLTINLTEKNTAKQRFTFSKQLPAAAFDDGGQMILVNHQHFIQSASSLHEDLLAWKRTSRFARSPGTGFAEAIYHAVAIITGTLVDVIGFEMKDWGQTARDIVATDIDIVLADTAGLTLLNPSILARQPNLPRQILGQIDSGTTRLLDRWRQEDGLQVHGVVHAAESQPFALMSADHPANQLVGLVDGGQGGLIFSESGHFLSIGAAGFWALAEPLPISLGTPAKTANVLRPHPSPPEDQPGGRVFPTHFSARYSASGAIHLAEPRNPSQIEAGLLNHILRALPHVHWGETSTPSKNLPPTAYVATTSGFTTDDLFQVLRQPGLPTPRAIIAMAPGSFKQTLPKSDSAPFFYRCPEEFICAAIWRETAPLDQYHQSYFANGGKVRHAPWLVNRLNHFFKTGLTYADFSKTATLRALSNHFAKPEPWTPGLPEADAPVLATPMQQTVWSRHQRQIATEPIILGLRLEGRLGLTALERALNLIIERNASTRLSLNKEGLRLYLRAEHAINNAIEMIDAKGLPGETRRESVQHIVRQAYSQPFNLDGKGFVRTVLIRVDTFRHQLWMIASPAFFDEMAMRNLFFEFAAYYGWFIRGPQKRGDLSAIDPFPKPSYHPLTLAKQRDERRQGERPKTRAHQLLNAATGIVTPFDLAELSGESRMDSFAFSLDTIHFESIDHFARSAKTVPAVVLMAVYSLLWSRYTNETKLLIGMRSRNRDLTPGERYIGRLEENFPILLTMEHQESGSAAVNRFNRALLDAMAFRDLPQEAIAEAFAEHNPCSNDSFLKLFFSWEDPAWFKPEPPSWAGLDSRGLKPPASPARSGIELKVQDLDGAYELIWHFPAGASNQELAQRLSWHFRTLLENLTRQPEATFRHLTMLTRSEMTQQLATWNQSNRGMVAPWNASFQRQVETRSDSVLARITGEDEYLPEHLSYSAAFQHASALTGQLALAGISPDKPLLVYLSRGKRSLLAKLAIRLGGFTCFPVEPDDDPIRFLRLLQNWHPKGVLTDTLHASQIELLFQNKDKIPIWYLDELGQMTTGHSQFGEKLTNHSESTNRVFPEPEPVTTAIIGMIDHGEKVHPLPISYQALDCAIADHLLRLQFQPGDNVADALPRELIAGNIHWQTTLYAGATLCLSRKVGVSGQVLAQATQRQYIAHLFLPSSYLRQLPFLVLPSLRSVSVTEAPRQQALAGRWGVERDFYTIYGHPETMDMGMTHLCDPYDQDSILGEPSYQAVVYLVDRDLRPVPAQSPGEILLGGPLLAQGYCGAPAFTASRFLPDPFQTIRTGLAGTLDLDAPAHPVHALQGGRVFRTGDIAKLDLDGRVHFLGSIRSRQRLQTTILSINETCKHSLSLIQVVESGPRWSKVLGSVLKTDTTLAKNDREYVAALTKIAASGYQPKVLLEDHLDEKDQELLVLKTPRVGAARVLFDLLEGYLGNRLDWDEFLPNIPNSHMALTETANILSSALDCPIPNTLFFEKPTIRLAAFSLDRNHVQVIPTDENNPISDESQLSGWQRELWRLTLGGSPLQGSAGVSLAGKLTTGILCQAIQSAGRRFPILTSNLTAKDGQPAFEKMAQPEANILLVDLTNLPANVLDITWQRIMEQAICEPVPFRGFHRCMILLTAPSHMDLIFTCHTLVGGRFTANAWLSETSRLHPYLQRWQKAPNQRPTWLPAASGAVISSATDLPTLTSPHVSTSQNAGIHTVMVKELPADQRAMVAKLSRELAINEEAHFIAALLLWLARTVNVRRPAILMPIYRVDRLLTDDSHNPIDWHVFFVSIDPEMTALKLMEEVRNRLIRLQFQRPPSFEKVQELMGEAERPPVIWISSPQEALLSSKSLSWIPMLPKRLPALGSLEISWLPDEDPSILWTYDEACYPSSVMEAWFESWFYLAESMAQKPHSRLSALPMLPPRRQKQILIDWNDTSQTFPGPPLLQQYMSRRAMRSPDAEAFIYTTKHRSGNMIPCTVAYRTLNMRANRLARALRSRGVTNDTPIAVFLQSAAATIITILGIWKAGGIVVPLPQAFPGPRRKAILEASGADWTIVEAGGKKPPIHEPDHMIILGKDGKFIGPRIEEDPNIELTPADQDADHLACLLFVSDENGKPRSAALTHRAVGNRVLGTQASAPLGPGDRFLQQADLGEPVTFWEYMSALVNGAATVAVPANTKNDAGSLLRFMQNMRITHLYLRPNQLSRLLDAWETLPPAEQPKPRCLFTGSGSLSAQLQRRCVDLTGLRPRHFFGTVETASTATLWDTPKGGSDREAGLGRPMPNTSVYVLDENLAPLPPGITGDVYLGGMSLARSYWQRPALTAAYFLPNPLSTDLGSRLFRTGGLGQWTPEGSLIHLGRSDRRCHIQGWRIECGEVEHHIQAHDAIDDAAVAFQTSGQLEEGFLIAYYVSQDKTLRPDHLRAFLATKLPTFMIPAVWTRLPVLPRLKNRKLDQAALPKLENEATLPFETI